MEVCYYRLVKRNLSGVCIGLVGPPILCIIPVSCKSFRAFTKGLLQRLLVSLVNSFVYLGTFLRNGSARSRNRFDGHNTGRTSSSSDGCLDASFCEFVAITLFDIVTRLVLNVLPTITVKFGL